MKARWRRLLHAGLWCTLAFGAAVLVYLRQNEDYAAEIRSGKLGYTSKTGWVNWGHARPEGVRVFLDDLYHRRQEAGERPFLVEYAQSMSCHWGKLGLESKLRRTYRVQGRLEPDELDRVALGIFREVSEAFETMQGRFPSSVDARSQSSSFRGGDLAGDSIAFYCAQHRYTLAEVREWLGTPSVDASLRELQHKGLEPSRSWRLPAEMAQSPLSQLEHDPRWFAQRVDLLEQHETCFRFRFVSNPHRFSVGSSVKE